MMDKEVIALLPPDDRTDGRQVSKVLVRYADGRMAIEDLSGSDMPPARSPVRFRRSNPIFDPMTREVIGYEMEQVRMLAEG
jgi:hypothetical protein